VTIRPQVVLSVLTDFNNEDKYMITITTTPVFFLGIDVGKKDLFCHIIIEKITHSETFDNTTTGIKKLLIWLGKLTTFDQLAACLEQTGHYGKDLAKALFNAKLAAVYMVNPRQIKAYGNQKLRRNKSDTADAKLIASFLRAEHHDLRPWTPPSIENEKITELSRYAESLTADTAKLKTKCEAVSNQAILRSLKRRIKSQEKELADIRQRINKLIQTKDSLVKQKFLLASIPGLGEITQHILIAELPDITLFSNARQVAAWAGITPRHYESGTSGSTRTPITKIGSCALRSALYLPAMSAKVHNPQLKKFAERLKQNGKTPKQIIVAIMRKLLHQVYGILTSGKPFDPNIRGFKPTTQSL